MNSQDSVTQLLQQWRMGDDEALEQLTPLVYGELHKRARRAFSGERAGHTLQPTALVHELFGRLVSAEVDWRDRSHFYALCSRMMRRILVDHARSRATAACRVLSWTTGPARLPPAMKSWSAWTAR